MFGFGKKHKTASNDAPATEAQEQSSRKPLFGRLFGGGKDKAEAPEQAPIAEVERVAPAPAAPIAEPTPAPEAPPEPPQRTFVPRALERRREEPVAFELPDLPEEAPEPEAEGGGKLFGRLRERLSRTRVKLGGGIGELLLGRKRIDDELLEELETLLITADVGIEATTRIIGDLTEQVQRKTLTDPQALVDALKAELRGILEQADAPVAQPAEGKPQVLLMVGINGAGKTTTIGKLAKRLQEEGNSVMLAAGDTFRAAAVEQLQTWGERNRIPVIAQHTGADSASVIYDALQAATARGTDVLIADTAGRLHTKSNLMDELSKVARVMKKIDPEAPHEVMLVVDATTGQNALAQAEHFHRAVGLTGITLTKLDGTAKGGIVFAIAERLQVPIRFIGVGETIEDLRYFDADEFVDALLG
ncbi:signal recognition particle-docking protein FtsY [Marichromatium gracile]|uniref:signal recognition particle-docking protein FtsY n=1 Tax=Marichromatium gracile TaxID=1048 RepID=UPI001912284D|nr:signal recognition particle-docking protein FtsY [Marichromatium gracile]